MIRNFGVRNYFCFREGAEVSFTFDGNVPDTIRQGSDLSWVLGIKGANGSGKTNLLKALTWLSAFVTLSAKHDTRMTPALGHFTSKDDTEFYIELTSGDLIYTYELVVNGSLVKYEAMHRKAQKTVPLLERQGDKLTYCIAELKELEQIRLREDASIISHYRQYRFQATMNDLECIFAQLSQVRSNVSPAGFESVENKIDLKEISARYQSNPQLFEFVKQIIRRADSAIEDIRIQSRLNDEGLEEFFPMFVHRYDDSDVMVPYAFESSGTKTLYRALAVYWGALQVGGLACIDEFDIHLHALILPDIINLFLNPQVNTRGAQLMFTAHNTEIIDTLGRYRTILVNKEQGASYCYRLDEIPGNLVRNDRPITPLYLKGKLGGVPQ